MRLSTKAVAIMLLVSSALAAGSQARVLLADTNVLGQPINWPISSGAVSEANIDQGVPAGRNCVASGNAFAAVTPSAAAKAAIWHFSAVDSFLYVASLSVKD